MTMTTTNLFRMFAVACIATAGAAHGAVLSIQFEGMDIAYDGTNIFDAPGSPDPLVAASISVDGSQVDSFVMADGISLDLFIPSVPSIAVDGPASLSAPGGDLRINFDAGGTEFLDLTLAEATVSYAELPSGGGTAEFTFIGSVAAIDSQALPGGLVIGDPVVVSASAQVDASTRVTGGPFDLITSFQASGTGEIFGTNVVPEPASAGLLVLGSLIGTMVASRYRLG